MWLTRISVARPLAVLAVFVAIALGGILAYSSMPINQLPNAQIPVVSVVTSYPGAGPEEIELQVTRYIEDAVSSLSDIDFITSTSTEGSSSVTVIFTDRANNDLIATQVERQVNGAIRSLPADADRPVVIKADLSALPVMQLAVTGEGLPPEELFRVADELVRPQIERLNGVSQVSLIGGRRQEVRVEVDPARLAGYGVSLGQIQSALAQANAQTPGGTISEGGREYSLRVFGLFRDPTDFGSVIVNTTEPPVRLRDVATVRLAARQQTQVTRVNHAEAVLIQVSQQSGANATDVTEAVRAALPRIQAEVPAGASLSVVQDGSVAIKESLLAVQNELIAAAGLTAVVLLIFLHSVRAAVIVLLAIPTTLLATVVAMRLFGFSFNVISTLGLTLTIGILVDDSIVILESILRRLGLGDEPTEAAINGRAQIGLAAVAITLVDVVIFTPITIVSGQIGAFFREFGLTIATATLFSLLVSFTLTPMLAARLLSSANAEGHGRGPLGRFGVWWDARFARLERAYGRMLQWGLGHRLVVLLIAGSTLVGGVLLMTTGRVATEFFPRSDQGLMTIATEMPLGTSLGAHDAVMRQVEERLLAFPEVKVLSASVGGGGGGNPFGGGSAGQARLGSVTIELVPRDQRRDIFAVAEEMRARLAELPTVKTRIDVIGAGGPGQPVSVRMQGSDGATLTRLAVQMEAALRAVPGLREVNNSAAVGVPEVRIQVDRARAEDLGVSAAALGQAVRAAYGGTVATRYRRTDGREIDVRVVLDEAARGRVATVADLPLQVGGTTVHLGQVATIEEVAGPARVDRRDRGRVITLSANLEPNVALGTVAPRVAQAVQSVALPPGYTATLGGQAEQQTTGFGQLGLALLVGILLAYLLMVVLYNSFIYPFVILFALPVAVGGAVGALWLFGYSFSIFAMIGLILLVGLAIKNGILLVDRANQNRARGMNRRAALLEAGPSRLRPILMTSLAIAVALTPTAMKIGEGAELRAPLAAAVLGGVISSTLLTLLVVPVMYTLLDALQGHAARLFGVGRASAPPAADRQVVQPRAD
jgi:HAE1 family hydrophobic/amphiphilic exporter-1